MIRKISLLGVVFLALASWAQGPVSYYGELKASGNKLVGSKTGNDKPVQVRGVSLGWSNTGWESSRFFQEASVNAMVDLWKAEVVRVPVGIAGSGYYAPGSSNPFAGKTANLARVEAAIDAAIAKDVYVIIDWHSHSAHNAAETEAAKEFFAYVAEKYGENDHVIFEIYNEPDQNDLTWATVKAYSEAVIEVIREYSDNLVIVGTLRWSQRIDHITPLVEDSENNLAYSLHFYAQMHGLNNTVASSGAISGTTRPTFKNAALKALNEVGVPIFVSEYGTTHNDGGQICSQNEIDSAHLKTAYANCALDKNPYKNFYSHNAENTNAWMEFLDEHQISSAAWNINHKFEGSAFFKLPTIPNRIGGGTNPGANPWTSTQSLVQWTPEQYADTNAMTASGAYIYNLLHKYAETAEWRNPQSVSHKTEARVKHNLGITVGRGAVTFTASQNSAISEISIYNLAGRKYFSQNLTTPSTQVKWSTAGKSNTPKGMYVARVKLNNGAVVQNSVLLK